MTQDRFQIDGSKISYHPDRVAQWLEAKDDWEKAKSVYPIYVEFSPAGACNHRCVFCAVDYIGYKTRFLDKDVLHGRLSEMGELGVRSIMYAGEGEPLLYKPLAETIRHTAESGISAAITTNATPLTEKFANEAIPYTTWIKASINAGTAETYEKIHKTKAKEFELVWKNMANAARIRDKLGLSAEHHTLGAQMVLLPENAPEALDFATRAKEAGLDYAVIKPYSQHNMSETREYEGMKYEDYLTMEDKLDDLNSDSFHVVFRRRTMGELDKPTQIYDKCYSTPFFWAYVMADGAVYGCSAYLEDERFVYGNMMDNTFKEVWEGEKRRQSFEYVRDGLDITECRRNCRMHKVNEALWDANKEEQPLVHLTLNKPEKKPAHVNFI
jgi:GTP 3',8-cyclase